MKFFVAIALAFAVSLEDENPFDNALVEGDDQIGTAVQIGPDGKVEEEDAQLGDDDAELLEEGDGDLGEDELPEEDEDDQLDNNDEDDAIDVTPQIATDDNLN